MKYSRNITAEEKKRIATTQNKVYGLFLESNFNGFITDTIKTTIPLAIKVYWNESDNELHPYDSRFEDTTVFPTLEEANQYIKNKHEIWHEWYSGKTVGFDRPKAEVLNAINRQELYEHIMNLMLQNPVNNNWKRIIKAGHELSTHMTMKESCIFNELLDEYEHKARRFYRDSSTETLYYRDNDYSIDPLSNTDIEELSRHTHRILEANAGKFGHVFTGASMILFAKFALYEVQKDDCSTLTEDQADHTMLMMEKLARDLVRELGEDNAVEPSAIRHFTEIISLFNAFMTRTRVPEKLRCNDRKFIMEQVRDYTENVVTRFNAAVLKLEFSLAEMPDNIPDNYLIKFRLKYSNLASYIKSHANNASEA